MKQPNELCESKTILALEIMVFEGKICGGCEMIRDLIAEVPFTDEEIAQMRQLVSKLDDALYSEGLMPVLKESAPELYERIDAVVKDMIKRDYSILRIQIWKRILITLVTYLLIFFQRVNES